MSVNIDYSPNNPSTINIGLSITLILILIVKYFDTFNRVWINDLSWQYDVALKQLLSIMHSDQNG